MKSAYALILSGIVGAGVAGLGGCTIQAHPAEVDIGPAVPAGYVYYNDPYYYNGWYDGPYWVWRDRGGRYWHERREFHDQRDGHWRR